MEEEITYIRMGDIEQPSLLDDFKKHLEESKKVVRTYNPNCFSGIYRNNTNPPSDSRKVYFYEFSDINRRPLEFNKVSHFIEWAKSHKVFLSSYTENQLRLNEVNYCVCYKGSTTVMVRTTYEELKLGFNNFGSFNSYNARCYDDYDYWD